jgi:hypothetical protein
MRYCFTFLLLVFASCLHAQNENYVKGRVLEYETGKPVPYVNVYLSGTTFGAASDDMGNFLIKAIPTGNYQMIASAIGYHSEIKNLNVNEKTSLIIDVSIRTKIYETESVSVSATRPERWNENYNEFKKLFLGSSDFSKECAIQNPEVLSFKTEGDNIITASADRPLIIINKALGYRIDCELINFSYERKSNRLKYNILPRFTEIEDIGKNYSSLRNAVYEKSIQYFLRSLIRNDFEQKGYKVYNRSFVDTDKDENYLKNIVTDSKPFLRKGDIEELYELSFSNYLKVIQKERTSWIKLEYDVVFINSSGFSNVFTPFEVRGYWATEGISTLLPVDYKGS